MTIEDVRKLIAHDEHISLEIKKTTGELKDGMHSACAFLNTNGGWLLFGIAPSTLKIIGQQVTDNTQREIAQALSYFYPAIFVKVEYIEIPERPNYKVIAMHFDGWTWGKEPYTYHGCPYYKVESTTKEMPRPMYDERLRVSKPQFFAWERQIAEYFSIDDISEKWLMNAIRMGIRGGRMPNSAQSMSVVEILENFNLIRNEKLINAAIMLFAKSTKDFPQLLLRMARFRGNDNKEFIDTQRVNGNFFELLDAGMAFCFKHMNLNGRVVGLRREEHLEIPVEALREALVNALCHRIYDKPGTSVGLAIFDDRVEIENPGRLPEGMTAENIKNSHKSQPYNPLIADVLYKTSWLESWGTGVSRMIDACKSQNIPEPYYTITPGFVTVVFKKGAYAKGSCINDCTSQLSERQKDVLNLITANCNITAKQVAEALHVSMRTASGDISFLRKKGFIDKSTKDNRSPWVIVKREES